MPNKMVFTRPRSYHLLIVIIVGLRTSYIRASSNNSHLSSNIGDFIPLISFVDYRNNNKNSNDNNDNNNTNSYNGDSNNSLRSNSPSRKSLTIISPSRMRRRRFIHFSGLPPSYIYEGMPLFPSFGLKQSRSLSVVTSEYTSPSGGLHFISVASGNSGNSGGGSGVGLKGPSLSSQYPGAWRQPKAAYWQLHSGFPVLTGPIMGHRTPRLIFRDNDSQSTKTSTATGRNHFFQHSNQLADSEEDYRECGISASKQTAQRRIVGGDEAGYGNFPWQAYIRIGSSRCGGTLVNRFHVVTAGHCVAKASARQVQVTLGDYVVNSASESLPAYTFGVREIRVHPYFKFTPQADRFDIAVLRLDRPVHYMPHIAPICLPDKNEDFLGQYGWAAGWGALQAGSRLRPKTLQSVDVPVIDNRVCERWHRSNGINVIIFEEMMCAGYRGGGKDSCQGDSGGPLMLEKLGKWYLIGIVSAGYSCAQPGQPGIYHRVTKTVDWITYVINS